jgi:hypothetical protein
MLRIRKQTINVNFATKNDKIIITPVHSRIAASLLLALALACGGSGGSGRGTGSSPGPVPVLVGVTPD